MAGVEPGWVAKDVGIAPRPTPPPKVHHHIPDRREFKYLMPRSGVPALRSLLRGICEEDPFAGPDGTYTLRSLYLDTWDMRLFKANEREAPIRFKARIRCYPEGRADGPVFAEIKGRDGDVIRKTRAKLPADRWAELLQGAPPGKHASAALDDYVSRVHRFALQPICAVEYRREAWASTIDEYARVSIDYQVQCRPETEWSLAGNGRVVPTDTPLPTSTRESICVVELKWADAVPRWMVNLVQALELERYSFSKYCYSVVALNDEHFVDYRRSSSVWA